MFVTGGLDALYSHFVEKVCRCLQNSSKLNFVYALACVFEKSFSIFKMGHHTVTHADKILSLGRCFDLIELSLMFVFVNP